MIDKQLVGLVASLGPTFKAIVELLQRDGIAIGGAPAVPTAPSTGFVGAPLPPQQLQDDEQAPRQQPQPAPPQAPAGNQGIPTTPAGLPIVTKVVSEPVLNWIGKLTTKMEQAQRDLAKVGGSSPSLNFMTDLGRVGSRLTGNDIDKWNRWRVDKSQARQGWIVPPMPPSPQPAAVVSQGGPQAPMPPAMPPGPGSPPPEMPPPAAAGPIPTPVLPPLPTAPPSASQSPFQVSQGMAPPSAPGPLPVASPVPTPSPAAPVIAAPAPPMPPRAPIASATAAPVPTWKSPTTPVIAAPGPGPAGLAPEWPQADPQAPPPPQEEPRDRTTRLGMPPPPPLPTVTTATAAPPWLSDARQMGQPSGLGPTQATNAMGGAANASKAGGFGGEGDLVSTMQSLIAVLERILVKAETYSQKTGDGDADQSEQTANRRSMWSAASSDSGGGDGGGSGSSLGGVASFVTGVMRPHQFQNPSHFE